MTTPAASFESAPATLAFDRLARTYDALADGEIFQRLRRRTHAVFARRFHAGNRILEIGCGTGIDTAFFASHGLRVVACDPSEAMVSRSLRRMAREGREGQVTVVPCGLQDVASFLHAVADPGGFDGIVSNFGALNCAEHLAPLGALARRELRPGGVVMVGLMNRTCAFEMIYLLATRRENLVARRLADGAVAVPVAGVNVPTFYHRIADVKAALGPGLTLKRVRGLGVAIPPPYFEPRWKQTPRALRRLIVGLDTMLSPWPPFNRLGDHILLEFAKEARRRA
ncbi:MAG: class I SAM-dependent methyltransferase [Acidobacteriota bacterium]